MKNNNNKNNTNTNKNKNNKRKKKKGARDVRQRAWRGRPPRGAPQRQPH